jgi:hypothetical protein
MSAEQRPESEIQDGAVRPDPHDTGVLWSVRNAKTYAQLLSVSGAPGIDVVKVKDRKRS